MKTENKSNIVLIGMPGAGKSTVGVILAKHTSYDFIDSDVLIQTQENRSLQQIVDEDGYMALRKIEETILLSINCTNHVIATGGSAVYSPAAMNHLKTNGFVIFLHTDFEVLQKRITDFETRGIARDPDQTFAHLYKERQVLYKKYSDLTIDCADKTQEDTSKLICSWLNIQ